MPYPLVHDEIDVLTRLLPMPAGEVIELGCGAATLARVLCARWPGMRYLGLEVDRRQLALNLQSAPDRMRFVEAGAQAIPADDACFDLALMLKSLHHIPVPLMNQALAEVARVLRPGGHMYVSEPVYAGAFNDVIKVYNDEGVVRAAVQRAIDDALVRHGSCWHQVAEECFATSAHFEDFADFERRNMHPTFADHHIDAALRARTAAAFAPYCTAKGATFERPVHVRLLQRVV